MKKLTDDLIVEFVDNHCDDYLLGVALSELIGSIQEEDIDLKQKKLDKVNFLY
jgi:hypothetical protein